MNNCGQKHLLSLYSVQVFTEQRELREHQTRPSYLVCVELTAHYQEWLKEVEKLRVEMTQGKMWAVVGLHVEEEHHHMIVTCQRWLLLPMCMYIVHPHTLKHMLIYVHELHVHACTYTLIVY